MFYFFTLSLLDEIQIFKARRVLAAARQNAVPLAACRERQIPQSVFMSLKKPAFQVKVKLNWMFSNEKLVNRINCYFLPTSPFKIKQEETIRLLLFLHKNVLQRRKKFCTKVWLFSNSQVVDDMYIYLQKRCCASQMGQFKNAVTCCCNIEFETSVEFHLLRGWCGRLLIIRSFKTP